MANGPVSRNQLVTTTASAVIAMIGAMFVMIRYVGPHPDAMTKSEGVILAEQIQRTAESVTRLSDTMTKNLAELSEVVTRLRIQVAEEHGSRQK